jgi:copper chaperone CopZ
MKFQASRLLRQLPFIWMFLAGSHLHAQYERIELRVYGLDCELCARGVAASVSRLEGVKFVQVRLKEGIVDVVLKPDSSFRMSSLRKRIRENGFRPMEAKVTALGKFEGARFEVTGSGESYEVSAAAQKTPLPIELTFEAR